MQEPAIAVAVAISAIGIAATCVLLAIRVARTLDRLKGASTIVPASGLPFGDIEVLAMGNTDRGDAIKEFFDWKHKALLKLLEMGAGFLLANALVLLKLSIAPDESASKLFREAIGLDLRATTIAVVAFVSIAVIVCSRRLHRLPDEYMIAVMFLSWLRSAK